MTAHCSEGWVYSAGRELQEQLKASSVFSFWLDFRTTILRGFLANTYWHYHEDALLLTPFVALLTELPSPDEYVREICLVLE